MTTMSHEPATVVRRPWWSDARDMWASLAISVMWLVVFATALFGPDFRSVDAAGNSTTIPSALGVSLFALFGTMSAAKYGFGKKTTDN